MAKYVFITGGVVSSLGKGVVSASLGLLLRSRGLKVSFLKFDPYLNRDAGTMNPYQHGEVFVTEDGAETDLDLGHYERFADVVLGRVNNVTTGQIYGDVLDQERRGCYEGATVQVIPHIVDTIKGKIDRAVAATDPDVMLVELGGTIGDIEGMPFIEAIRQYMLDAGRNDAILLHLVLLPGLPANHEIKTKPAQHSAQKLRECGLHMDFLMCRSEQPLSKDVRDKLALYSNLRPEQVIDVPDVKIIYDVHDRLHRQNLDAMVVKRLGLNANEPDLTPWRTFSAAVANPEDTVRIAAVGKYAELADSYKSLNEALLHAAAANKIKLAVDWIEAEDLETGDPATILDKHHGLVIPAGFGFRCSIGKIKAIQWARENKIPFLGLCYGLQCAVIEFARNICGDPNAVSAEWEEEGEIDQNHAWVTLLDNQGRATPRGGTLRLGSQPCVLESGSKAHAAYGVENITERHRHRFEVNPDKTALLEKHGLKISGRHPESGLVEVIELPGDQWFVATQAHPEFKSRPLRPHPLFLSFVDAVLKQTGKK